MLRPIPKALLARVFFTVKRMRSKVSGIGLDNI